MYTHICQGCNRPFEYKNKKRVFCSFKCKYPKQKRPCSRCGKVLNVTAISTQVYCNKLCKNPPTLQKCPNCNLEFRTTPSARKKYCSKECRISKNKKTVRDIFWYKKLFWQKVHKGNKNNCWIWTGCVNNKGYGVFRLSPTYQVSKHIYAHRFSFQATTDIDPFGKEVLHSCDNPPCVNPAHLSLGTHKENMQDMAKKQRAWNRKFLPEEVLDIRGSELTSKEIAYALSVAESTIIRIKNRKTYNWLK